MDKRTFLKTFKKESVVSNKNTNSFFALSSLTPYTGEWTQKQANHLLSRTVFGHSLEMLNSTTQTGLELTVDKLLEDLDTPSPPINYYQDNDTNAPIGETWVFTETLDTPGVIASRRRSLRAWQIGKIHEAGINLREKMVLFWHDHFPIGNINSPRVEYQYLDILQRNAMGNFKNLLDEITISPAMLVYLNGLQNSKESPNENYARELLELFTLGRGEAVGNGDYTNYTEQDVSEIARILTGWRTREFTDTDPLPIGRFVSARHDTGTKQLSHRFDNVIIENENENEYKRVIDLIFEKSETARHICRQLHIWFVGSDINEDVEMNIIEPLAQIMVDNNYNVKPVLRALLLSEYFHEPDRRGCLINSPIDFMFKLFNNFEVSFPQNILIKYSLWLRLSQILELFEMEILQVPSVAGWKAYYQSPQYYKFWINAVTLNLRDEFIQLISDGVMSETLDINISIDYLEFITKLDNPTDPQLLIEQLASLAFASDISQNQVDYLKEVLIPGLPDFEWTVEYTEYLADPEDPAKKNAVESKLKSLFNALMRMPEFYLM